ncbi:hypothetical protein SAMN05444141_11156 [Pseudovibrio denitrificans]|uniref:Uncharacterized protein n=1 Tax=Pseudovibrio denitrificans TaxID=258256 RepID=A0A1I7DV74_9HYPH|nr:hypothetical protein SAMN05444141_11156 [Pseudovibrio denitrificans]
MEVPLLIYPQVTRVSLMFNIWKKDLDTVRLIAFHAEMR